MKPFSQLCELSAYASGIVYSESKDPRVVWSENMDAVMVDGEKVSLSLLQDGLRALTHDLEHRILSLTGETTTPDWLSPDIDIACGKPVKDIPRERAPGYSFLDNERFRDAHLPLLQRLVEDPGWRLGMVDNNGSWVWNMSSIHRFFGATDEIQRVLMPLMQICTAGTRRGTELGDTKFANTPSRPRNLQVIHGRLYNIGRYTKTSELMGHDSYLPSLLPAEVSRPLIHFLVTIRRVESLLSRVVWEQDKQAQAAYQSHLFVSRGRVLGSADGSQYLKEFFKTSCNASIGLNCWRQLSASISREFIDDRHLTASRPRDRGMGHSTSVSRGHYGQDIDLPEWVSSDIIYEQTWIDEQFHAILGFGAKRPPTAIRLRDSADADAIMTAIANHLPTIIRPILIEELRKTAAGDWLGGVQEMIRAELATHACLRGQLHSSPSSSKPHQASSILAVPAAPTSLPYPSCPPLPLPPSSPFYPPHHHQFSSPAPGSELLYQHQKQLEEAGLLRNGMQHPPARPLPPDSSRTSHHHLFSSPAPDSEPSRQQRLLEEMGPSRSGTPCPPPPNRHTPFPPQCLPSEGEAKAGQAVFESEAEVDVGADAEAATAAFSALRCLHGKDAAPRSEAQLRLCVEVLKKKKDIVAVLPTGSGKSAAWLVPALVEPECITLVVVPFRALLEQHLYEAQRHGIQAERWTAKVGNSVPKKTNLLFAACESIDSTSFRL